MGIKPTVGLTSRAGVIPISESFDTVGTFGRTVLDAVQGLNAIVGTDTDDPATQALGVMREQDYTTFISSGTSLRGARFGLPIKRCWEFVPEDQKQVVSNILEAMKDAGAEIVSTDFPCAEERIQEDGSWNW